MVGRLVRWALLVAASMLRMADLRAQDATAPPAPTAATTSEPRTEADRRILAEAGELEREVARLRSRPFTAPVAKQVFSREQLVGFLARAFADSDAQDELRREQAFLRAIGFLPAETSLGDLYQEMLTSQVAGFYDPKDRTLRCISSDIAFVQRVTMVHEIYHSLQDQYAPLDPFMRGADAAGRRSDRARARQAVVEGDAQFFTMSIYLPQHQAAVKADLGSQAPGELIGFGLGQALAAASIPPYLSESLTWPYLAGSQFIGALHQSGGWQAVDDAFAQPPLSSEQILHPKKYQDGVDPPLVVVAPIPAFAAGRGELLRDTMGEAAIAGLLTHMGRDPVHAMRGSEGWGGDEVVVLGGGAGEELLIWMLAWDSARDGEQFFAAWRRVILKQYGADSVAALPPRLAGVPLPEGTSVCAAEPAGVPCMWLLRRGDRALVLRGSELDERPPSDLAALAETLSP